MINWILIKNEVKRVPDKHNPNYVMSFDNSNKYLNNVNVLSFKESSEKPTSFWKDKVSLFRLEWQNASTQVHYANNALKYSKICWVCPSSVDFLTNKYRIDKINNIKDGFNKLLLNNTKYIISEVPVQLNMFPNCTVVQMRSYCKELEAKYQEKIYDVFGFIDTYRYNKEKTLDILKILSNKGYKVVCMSANFKISNKYNFDIINNKKPGGHNLFREYLSKSKVFLDLNKRITVGRTVYESLVYGGCLSVCTNTYTASNLLFSEYSIDPNNHRNPYILRKCEKAITNWSDNTINQKRNYAGKVASPEVFFKELEQKTMMNL